MGEVSLERLKFWLALCMKRCIAHGNKQVVLASEQAKRDTWHKCYRIALKHSPKAAQAILNEMREKVYE